MNPESGNLAASAHASIDPETLTPAEVVAYLDRFIIGQSAAKRAVAVALRNRIRRARLAPEVRADITPRNILMIGPTGVGKTEIARRLAALVQAPLLKIEATRFTEVGYVGRDVDQIARDLVEVAVALVEKEHLERARLRARDAARGRLLDLLAPEPQSSSAFPSPPFAPGFGGAFPGMWPGAVAPEPDPESRERARRLRERMAQKLDAGELEDAEVEVEVEERRATPLGASVGMPPEVGFDWGEMLQGLVPPQRKKRRMRLTAAREVIEHQEAEKLLDRDAIASQAIERAQERGIVFLDEIDKVAGRGEVAGASSGVSREGVQRDLLPLVEGATVQTKYGPVKTDHVLFIAAGAFHLTKPSDLIPELQGRFPVRVELEPLTEIDLARVLREPVGSLLDQYRLLLGTDGIELEWAPEGVAEIARLAAQVNAKSEDIGARRLHTLLEKVLEELSFEAPAYHAAQAQSQGTAEPTKVIIDALWVRARLAHLIDDDDLSRLML